MRLGECSLNSAPPEEQCQYPLTVSRGRERQADPRCCLPERGLRIGRSREVARRNPRALGLWERPRGHRKPHEWTPGFGSLG